VTVQVGAVTKLPPEIVHPVSLNEKCVPTTLTVVPVGPDVGVADIEGARTVKVAVAASPPGLPVTVIVYVPGAVVPTTKDVDVKTLAVMLQVAGGIPITLPVPVTMQDVSVPENPVPLIETVCPTGPELGARLIVGSAATGGIMLKSGI